MILKFALTETFSANICTICITSMFCRSDELLFKTLIKHYKSIIFIEDDTEEIIMKYSPRCLLLIAPKSDVSLI